MSLNALCHPRTAVTLLAAASCALYAGSTHGRASQACVVVAGTSDTHGAIEPSIRRVGRTEVRYGGLIALSGYLRVMRQRYGDRLILLDGGDLFQGTLASNLSQGRAVLDAYNLLGYSGAAVGNHEFDYGPEQANVVDRLGVVKRRISEAVFPFLALNIFARATGKPVAWQNLKPSTLISAGDVRVGVMGIASPSTALTTRLANVSTLRFPDPVPLIADEAQRLRQLGAQLVVLVGHVGGKCADLSNPHRLTSCAPEQELFQILRALPHGTIDVAVAGHTHASLAHWVNGTAVIESAGHARHLAWVEACLLPSGGLDRARTHIQAPIPVCLDEWQHGGGCGPRDEPAPTEPARFLGQPVVPDPLLVERMRPYLAAVANAMEAPVGVCLPYALRRSGGAEPLGPLVAEAMRRVARADFAVQNAGGVRADLPEGLLTYGAIYTALPFDNQVVRITLRGAQIRALVEHMSAMDHRDPHAGRHGGPHLAGLRVRQSPAGLVLSRADGADVDPGQSYALATNDFLADGGSGLGFLFDGVPAESRIVTDWDMRDTLIQLLRQRFPPNGCRQTP